MYVDTLGQEAIEVQQNCACQSRHASFRRAKKQPLAALPNSRRAQHTVHMHACMVCVFLPLCSLYTRGNNVCAGHGIGRWWLCIIVMQITLKRMKTKFYNIAYRVSFCVQSGRTWCCYSNFPYLNICDSRRRIKIYEFESKQMQPLS